MVRSVAAANCSSTGATSWHVGQSFFTTAIKAIGPSQLPTLGDARPQPCEAVGLRDLLLPTPEERGHLVRGGDGCDDLDLQLFGEGVLVLLARIAAGLRPHLSRVHEVVQLAHD